jgi:hypothetical protein
MFANEVKADGYSYSAWGILSLRPDKRASNQGQVCAIERTKVAILREGIMASQTIGLLAYARQTLRKNKDFL